MKKKITLLCSCAFTGLLAIALCSATLPSKSHPSKAATKPEKPVDSGWRQLFNGKNLDGWKMVGPGSRYVENGLTGSHGGMGLCYWTKEKFDKCVICVV